MGAFSCGCPLAGPGRCEFHTGWSCHTIGGARVAGECPPCRRERWLGVGLSRTATSSRTFRPSRETMSLEGIEK